MNSSTLLPSVALAEAVEVWVVLLEAALLLSFSATFALLVELSACFDSN